MNGSAQKASWGSTKKDDNVWVCIRIYYIADMQSVKLKFYVKSFYLANAKVNSSTLTAIRPPT